MITKPLQSVFIGPKSAEAVSAALTRLMTNIPGFVYRSRPDPQRTMEFMSAHCRDVTGYDPHRFVGNQSLTYSLLIHPGDRRRVDETVFGAARSGRRFACHYRLRTAYGVFLDVVDRGIGVRDESGVLCAIEGYVSRACENRQQPSGASAEAMPFAASERGGDSSGFIGNDDATSELVDRLLPTRTDDIPATAPYVD